MPNQPAKNKKSVTVFLTKDLVAKLDHLAKSDDRSRSYVINKLLELQVEKDVAERKGKQD